MAPDRARGAAHRVLAVFPDPPWRGGSGSHMRDLEHLHALVALGVELAVLSFSDGSAAPPPPAWLGAGATILLPAKRPVAAASGLGPAVERGLGYLLRDLGPARGAHRRLAYPSTYLYDRVGALDLVCRTAEARGATAVLLRSWFLPWAGELRRCGLAVVLDAHDAQGRAAGEIFRTLAPARRWLSLPMLVATRRMEPRFLRFCDEVWVPSEEDAAALRAASPATRCVLYPNLVPLPEAAGGGDGDAAENTDRLLFVGNMAFPPNAQAAESLVADILPALRRHRPDVRLTIVGHDPPEAVRRAARGDPRLVVTGRVPDIAPYYRRAAVVVVPVWRGSGTKVKLLEALSFGKAVVATPKGVEGVAARDGVHLRVAERPAAIAEAVASLLANPALARLLGEAARELVRERYTFGLGPRILARESLLAAGGSRRDRVDHDGVTADEGPEPDTAAHRGRSAGDRSVPDTSLREAALTATAAGRDRSDGERSRQAGGAR